jgi:hypothetical protein
MKKEEMVGPVMSILHPCYLEHNPKAFSKITWVNAKDNE